MPNIYFDGIDPLLAPICEMFDIICNDNGINYTIKTDDIQLQEYKVTLRPKLVDLLRAAAAPDGVIVSYNNEILSVKPHRLSESRRTEYNIGQLDPAGLDKIRSWAIQYLGEKNRGPFSDIFNGMVLPVRIADVQSVWQRHLDDPRWNELGHEKSSYVDKPGDYPPIAMGEGRIIDGYKRLFAAHHRNDPLIEYFDMNDLITEANDHLNEDQYKSPTRRMINRQTAFRSSFGPSRSFGGVAGYTRVRRKRKASECKMNEYGKLTDDLMAHDNMTVIPKGSVVKVVDDDKGLPDIEWEGKIINVDRECLEKVWKSTSLSEQIDKALEAHDDTQSRVVTESEFENQLSEAFGSMTIVEPDILMTLNQDLDGKVIEEDTPKDK